MGPSGDPSRDSGQALVQRDAAQAAALASLERRTWAEIDLGKLAGNLRRIKVSLRPGVKVLAVVKANAYGHGAVESARALVAAGADGLGVAAAAEGATLRASGTRVPIVVLGGAPEGSEDVVVEHDLTPAVYTIESLERLARAARHRGRMVSCHVKVDTGLGRLGVDPSGVVALMAGARRLPEISVDGVFTHLSSADEDDGAYSRLQVQRFGETLRAMDDAGFSVPLRHAANSAGTLFYPEAWFDMVRPGLALYGVHPNPRKGPFPLEPVMSLKTRVVLVKRVPPGTPLGYNRTFTTARESLVATLPVGYADGYNRLLSNRGRVIVRGRFAPVVGAVSMDLTLVDVTDVPGTRIGDEVVLLGRQGDLAITAEETAELTRSIPHEVFCAVGSRVPRVFVGEETSS